MTEHSVSQSSAKPVAKVVAVWVTGAGASVVLALLALLNDSIDQQTFWGGLGASAVAGLAGYLQKSRTTDR